MFGIIKCWFTGEHAWEHRVQFIIMHYWRCKRCSKAVDFDSPEVPASVREQDARERELMLVRWQAERAAYDKSVEDDMNAFNDQQNARRVAIGVEPIKQHWVAKLGRYEPD